MVGSKYSLPLSAEEFIRPSRWKLLPLNQCRHCLGFGLKVAILDSVMSDV
jgi:hypothetical protein